MKFGQICVNWLIYGLIKMLHMKFKEILWKLMNLLFDQNAGIVSYMVIFVKNIWVPFVERVSITVGLSSLLEIFQAEENFH